MDWLTFLSKLIDSLAWPVSVFLVAVLVRKPLRSLMPLLHRLKYKELELEFGQRVEEIKTELARELPKESQLALPSAEAQPLVRLAEVSPRSAVLEAWRGVELAALEAARKLAGDEFRNRTLTYQALRFLERNKAIDGNVITLLRDLRGLRNDAAHAPDFALSSTSAVQYAASAEAVARYLREVKEGAPNQGVERTGDPLGGSPSAHP